jgi:hypothetical protein
MPETTETTGQQPSATWVRFLRNYGPIPTNGNLFDEHVSKALARAKVEAIVLPTPRLDEMFHALDAGAGSLLVAGTAGDGKTFHCRSLWELLGGDKTIWSGKGSIKRLEYRGRQIVFVKDMSELGLGDSDSQNILEGLEHSVAGDDSVSYVIATNHGKILEHLRARAERVGVESPLRDPIQDTFLNPNMRHPRLKVVDLSKAGNRSSLEDVLNAVAGHKEWSRCESCTLNFSCPISENRRRIQGAADGGLFAKRLGDLVELSRLNGAHLPVRDLLTLVANALLGHPKAKEGLMTCADVPKFQENCSVDQASLYRNVFGANLKTKRAMAQPVFRILSVFGVGAETANGIDGLLVYGSDDGRLQESFKTLVANDPMYGASSAFIDAQMKYLEGNNSTTEEGDENVFLTRLADQRRRLFFTLPNNAGLSYPYWGLTAFRHAGDYLAVVESLEGVRSPVAEKAKNFIIKGLNRVFTGLLLENTDKLFVADGGGSARSRTSVLCQTEILVKRSGGIGLSIRKDEVTGNPCVEAVVVTKQPPVLFDLTPIRFEFLCRVAEGALPGSFSNECLEDLLAFKARILRQAEAEREKFAKENGGVLDPEVALSFIEINDRNGNGSLESIIVRVQA